MLAGGLGASLLIGFWFHSQTEYTLGPLFSIAGFLIAPVALTIVVPEAWTLVLTPFLFWSGAWAPLFWIDHLTLSGDQPLLILAGYGLASVASGALGILLRRYLAGFNRHLSMGG